jgi:hypothetical protein
MSVPNTIKLNVPVNAECLFISNRSMSMVGEHTSTVGFTGEFRWGTAEQCKPVPIRTVRDDLKMTVYSSRADQDGGAEAGFGDFEPSHTFHD